MGFLSRRVLRHGWRQWWRGLRQRRVGYAAMELAAVLPSQAGFVVDVGGHHGDVSAALDLLYAPRRLWVVEPNPALTAGLQARFAACPHVTVIPQCLGDTVGEVTLNVHEFDAASSLFTCQPGHLEKFGFQGRHHPAVVPMTTLAKLLEPEGSVPIDLLKLDCQGAELAVLHGAGSRLQDVRWVYCEVAFDPIYANAPLFDSVHRFLTDAGFELRHLGEFAGAAGSIQWGDALYRNRGLPS